MTTYKGVGVCRPRYWPPVLQMPKPIEEPKDGLRLSGETAEAAAQRIRTHRSASRKTCWLAQRMQAVTVRLF